MLYVITGPPAAGKSTWVMARAHAADIVIDLDRITRALTGPGAPQWNHAPVASKVALRARASAIDEALKHCDSTDVYLIHTMPSPQVRSRYLAHGAHIITVDPGRAIVEQRVKDMRSPGLMSVVTRWYDTYRKGGSRPLTTQYSRDW